MIITIDGPAAAGKGTLAQKLAEKYALTYFDTGMIYRAVGLEMRLNNQDCSNESLALDVARKMTFIKMKELAKNPELRSSEGGKAASIVSAHPLVRTALLDMQRNFALNPKFENGVDAKGVVFDGRDTGTVVCPNADIKFFITASPEVRAQRRYLEFLAKGNDISFEQVFSDVKTRDERDTNRSTAPLKPADDAHIFDTSELGIEEVMQKACKIIDFYQQKA